MSKFSQEAAFALATTSFVLSRAWRYFCRVSAVCRPTQVCKQLSSQQQQRGLRHSTKESSSDRWVVRCASLHMFLSQLQVSLYETVTTQFQRRPPSVVSGRNLWSTFSAKLRRTASSTNASHRILFCLFW